MNWYDLDIYLIIIRKKQEFTISNNNDEIESINGDYLNVTLRLFESQGWLKRYLNDKQSINIIPTDEGIDIFNNSSIYFSKIKTI